jgi:DNA-binding NarL/FixJ family response regulator
MVRVLPRLFRAIVTEVSGRKPRQEFHAMTVPIDTEGDDIPQSERRPTRAAAGTPCAGELHDTLHDQAVGADAGATTELHLALLWRELSRGVSTIVDSFFTLERCGLVLAPSASPSPVDNRRLEILKTVLCGSRQKNIAIDFRLAPSTVALNSRMAMESLGLSGKPSRAHPLLMLAACASSEQLTLAAKCSVIRSRDGRELRVVGLARPDLALAKRLPAAELSVIRSLVEGQSYRQIAAARGTSTRTIANQISAVFRRLRVSGRNELVLRLFLEQALGPTARPPEPPTPTTSPPLATAQAPSHASPRRSA